MSDKSFHFIAIGGVGQSALAKILALRGFKITGSDAVESKYTNSLKELGVKVYIGQRKENIKGAPEIVLSSAIKKDNPELIKAKELNLNLYHRSDILKLISEQYPCFIGFSGTHGKTTTSGMCSFILENTGARPSYATGGIISNLGINANAYKDSEIFIAELDESDGTIVKYSPDYIAINNLEPDHFDFYKNGEKDLIAMFEKFSHNLKKTAKIFLNIDDEGVKKLIPSLNRESVITYSLKDKTASYYAGEIELNKDYNSFSFYKNGKLTGKVKTKIKGVHNIYNTLCVFSVLIEKGFKFDEIAPSAFEFLGMGRRFEKLYEGKISVYDDYAHHPTEIKATLENAKNIAKSDIAVIFQPHRYTRLKALWDEFLLSFNLADKLFVVDTYSAGDKYDEEYNSKNFAEKINHKCVKYIKGTMDEAAIEIAKYINDGDFVISIGAGDVTKIGHLIGEIYEKR